MIRNFILLFFLSLITTAVFGQAGEEIEMADALYRNGKIYVVVTSVLLILLGLLLYMISLERKVKQLEKKVRDHDQNKFHA